MYICTIYYLTLSELISNPNIDQAIIAKKDRRAFSVPHFYDCRHVALLKEGKWQFGKCVLNLYYKWSKQKVVG